MRARVLLVDGRGQTQWAGVDDPSVAVIPVRLRVEAPPGTLAWRLVRFCRTADAVEGAAVFRCAESVFTGGPR